MAKNNFSDYSKELQTMKEAAYAVTDQFSKFRKDQAKVEDLGKRKKLAEDVEEKCLKVIMDIIKKSFPADPIFSKKENDSDAAEHIANGERMWGVTALQGADHLASRVHKDYASVVIAFRDYMTQAAILLLPGTEEAFSTRNEGTYKQIALESEPKRLILPQKVPALKDAWLEMQAPINTQEQSANLQFRLPKLLEKNTPESIHPGAAIVSRVAHMLDADKTHIDGLILDAKRFTWWELEAMKALVTQAGGSMVEMTMKAKGNQLEDYDPQGGGTAVVAINDEMAKKIINPGYGEY